MRRIIFSSVTFMAVQGFSTLSHKWHNFREGFIEDKMCILIFSATFVCDISHSKKNSARYCHKYTNVFMWSAHYACQLL